MQQYQCYFCGEAATTREHVPPKGMFPKKARKDLLSVPSCKCHNNAKSGDDEYFRMVVSGIAWNQLDSSLQDTIIRSVSRKPALAAKLIAQTGSLNGGLLHYDVELPRIQLVLESIARGILFHEFGSVERRQALVIGDFLDISSSTQPYIHGKYEVLREECRKLLLELPERGGNRKVFSYKCTYGGVQLRFYTKLLATVLFLDENAE